MEWAIGAIGVLIGLGIGTAVMFWYMQWKLKQHLKGFETIRSLANEVIQVLSKNELARVDLPTVPGLDMKFLLQKLTELIDRVDTMESKFRKGGARPVSTNEAQHEIVNGLKAGFLKDGYFDLEAPRLLFVLDTGSQTPGQAGTFHITSNINEQNWLIKNHINGAMRHYFELEGNFSTQATRIVVLQAGTIVCDAPNKWRIVKKMRVRLE